MSNLKAIEIKNAGLNGKIEISADRTIFLTTDTHKYIAYGYGYDPSETIVFSNESKDFLESIEWEEMTLEEYNNTSRNPYGSYEEQCNLHALGCIDMDETI